MKGRTAAAAVVGVILLPGVGLGGCASRPERRELAQATERADAASLRGSERPDAEVAARQFSKAEPSTGGAGGRSPTHSTDATPPRSTSARLDQAVRAVRRATDGARLRPREAALASVRRLDEIAKGHPDPAADRGAAALFERLYRVFGDPADLASARARLGRVAGCEAALARAGLAAEEGRDLRLAYRELSAVAGRHPGEPCGRTAARAASILIAFAPPGTAPPDAVVPVAEPHGSSDAPPVADSPAATGPPTVSRIAMWPEGVSTRVAIYVDRACPFMKVEDPRGLKVRLPGAALGRGVPAERPNGLGVVRSIRARRHGDGIEVLLDVTGAVRYRVFPMGGPYRIIVDVARPEVSRALAAIPAVRRIVVDAGHGGHDPGARGPATSVEEKAVTLEIATIVARLLVERLGVEVVMTRKDDRFVALEERTALANGAGADLFVSIHANAAPTPDQNGVETFVLARSSERDALKVAARENRTDVHDVTALGAILATLGLESHQRPSEALAGLVQDRLVRRLRARFGGVQDRGVRRAMFYVLVGAHMPAILVETSFLTNPVEEARLATEAYRRELAEGIYEGIAAYVRQPDQSIWVDVPP